MIHDTNERCPCSRPRPKIRRLGALSNQDVLDQYGAVVPDASLDEFGNPLGHALPPAQETTTGDAARSAPTSAPTNYALLALAGVGTLLLLNLFTGKRR